MLVRFALIATGLALLSILALDGHLAMTVSSVPAGVRQAINQGVIATEWLFGFRISVYLYGGLLVAAGAVGLGDWPPGSSGRGDLKFRKEHRSVV